MPTLEQLERELEEKKAAGREILAKDCDLATKQEEYKALGLDDLNKLIAQEKSLVEMRKSVEPMSESNTGAGEGAPDTAPNNALVGKSLGDWIVNAEPFKAIQDMGRRKVRSFMPINFELPVKDVKATLLSGGASGTGAADAVPLARTLPGVIDIRTQPLTIANLIPSTSIDQPSIRVVVEDTWTNAASVVGEGVRKPEDVLQYVARTEEVTKVAHWIKVSDESLADIGYLRGLIDARLRLGVLIHEEYQILSGDGNGINLSGILDRTGVQTQAQGSDNNAVAIRKAMTLLEVNAFTRANGVVIHPNNWQSCLLQRDASGGSEGTGQYFAGGPYLGAYGNGQYQMTGSIWGLPVVTTTAISEGEALVGNFMDALLLRREGVTVQAEREGTDFTQNLITILAESRLGLHVSRPSSFCHVTGLD
jgi:HK97 family phage major capsid protein